MMMMMNDDDEKKMFRKIPLNFAHDQFEKKMLYFRKSAKNFFMRKTL